MLALEYMSVYEHMCVNMCTGCVCVCVCVRNERLELETEQEGIPLGSCISVQMTKSSILCTEYIQRKEFPGSLERILEITCLPHQADYRGNIMKQDTRRRHE